MLKCDFENGMCGWSSSRQGGNALSWVLTNTATPEADTGPLWGHPKGSYYVYTDTRKAVPDQTGNLRLMLALSQTVVILPWKKVPQKS